MRRFLRLPTRSVLTAALVAGVVLGGGAPAAAQSASSFSLPGTPLPIGGPSNSSDPFYIPPTPLPPGRPGDVIRAEPMDAYDSGGKTRLPGRAWRILYRSTSALGSPIAVSGTVLVPTTASPGPRPIIGYSVGTRGIADRCAPSHTLASGGEPESNNVRSLLERGWAVAFTDWQGLGTPGDHTYVVGPAEGHAVLDAIRAARRLKAAGLPAHGPLGLLGYSQGGHSTAWAAQVQPTYAPELRLAGVAAGAVPSDLQKVSDHVDGSYAAGLVLYAAVGLNAAYPELRLDHYLNAAGRVAIAQVRNSCLLDGSIAQFAFHHSTDYTTTDVPRLPAWRARLRQNGVGAIAPRAPVLLYHGRRDELIPFALSEELRARWCRMGVNVRLQEIPGAVDHSVSGEGLGSPIAIDWLAQRFASGPPPQPSDCPLRARATRVRLRLTFPGGPWRHVTHRFWRIDARALSGTLRGLTLTVRDRRGRLVGRSAPRALRGRAHVYVRLRRRLRPRQRYAIVATARRVDGTRLRKEVAIRLPARPRRPVTRHARR